jgi:hypothetical protein
MQHWKIRLVPCLLVYVFSVSCLHRAKDSSSADEKNRDLQEISRFSTKSCRIHAVALDPQHSSRLAIYHGDSSLLVYDLSKQAAVWDREMPTAPGRNIPDQGGDFHSIRFDKNSESVFVSSGSVIIELDGRDGSTRRSFEQPTDSTERIFSYTAMALTSDDRFLAVIGALETPPNFSIFELTDFDYGTQLSKKKFKQRLQLWDRETAKLVRQADFEDSLIREVGFSPNGTRIHATSLDNFRVFDGSTLTTIADLDIKATISGESGFSYITTSSVTDDLRFVAIKSLSRIYVINTESSRIVSSFGWSTEGLNSILAMRMNQEATEIWLTDLDGMYLKFSLPDGEYLEGGHSSGNGRDKDKRKRMQGLFAMDIERRFAIEAVPPDRPPFPIESDPTRRPNPDKCDAIRVVKL